MWKCVVASAVVSQAAGSGVAAADPVNTVFVIAMENHNWTQPASDTSAPHQIFNNTNAPFINSIVNPGFNGGALNPQVTLFGTGAPISINAQVSYATAYHNVLATSSGANAHIHPSEPNYIWSEAGTNFGVTNDNTPYGTSGNNQNTTAHLSSYLQQAGRSWKSYEEDIDTDSAGNVLPQNQWISPINNRSGTYTAVANSYNGSKQYDYAVKHDPQAFFADTNGGNNATSTNPAAVHYAPLQQLQIDLNNNSPAQYNWITPNQFNDMHTALSGGYKGLTSDNAQVKQGDDFLAAVVPTIMSSQAYKNNGAIIIWNDESEGTNADDFNHTIMEIIISPLAKGHGYASSLNYTHSSDLKTMQEIFQVGPLLGDAAASGTLDLSDLFVPNTIPTTVPEPSSLVLTMLASTAIAGIYWLRREASKRRQWETPMPSPAAARLRLSAIAVGTALTGRPPHRSVREALPHTAPTLSRARNRTLGVRVDDVGAREVFTHQAVHS